MKEKLIRFMQGRYGVDPFTRFLMGVALACMILSFFTRSMVWSFIILLLLVYCYFRMFSKNIYKRTAENRIYQEKTYKIRCFFARQKNMMSQRKEYHIYKCPSCSQKIRIPRGKGRIEVRCPKCSTTFIKNS